MIRAYIHIVRVSCIIILLILGLFQAIWVYGGSASAIMNQTGLQRARVQAITKDVLILAYRPALDHPQAVSELQLVLPAWEKTQRGLSSGDSSLQLPTHVPDDIAPLVATTQPDFTAIDTAVHVILAHVDNPVDPIQLTIILDHEHNYALLMSQLNNAWQARIDSAFLHIFWIETALTTTAIVLTVVIATMVAHAFKVADARPPPTP